MVKKNQHFFLIVLLLCSSYVSAFNPVITTIPVGDSPAGSAITSDNRFVYVANNNGNTVSVIDAKSNTVIKTIADTSFNQPYTITLNNDTAKAYVTNSNGTTVTIIDIKANTVLGTIDGFDGPSGLVILPGKMLAYVNNYGGPEGVLSGNGRTISVVDLQTNTIIGAPIIVGLAPSALARSPRGDFVYVTNYVDGNPGTGTMSVLQTSNNKVIATIPGFSGPFALAITPNGRYAYVTNFGSNNFTPVGTTVSVVDLQSYKIVDTISLGTQPAGIALTPCGSLAYVTNYNTLYLGPNLTDLTPGPGTVNIIDTCTNKVLPCVINVGSSPGNITISPNGARAYVSNYSSDNVTVLNVFERMWLKGS